MRRIVVAGTGSGVGKTTITLGLMSAFKQKDMLFKGLNVGQIILIRRIIPR